MSTVTISGRKLQIWPFLHDPDDEKFYFFVWKPPVWQASTEYLQDSVVRPSEANGFFYICQVPGISDDTEPTFSTKVEVLTNDNGIKWKSQPYNLALNEQDSIVSSSWSSDEGISISADDLIDGVTFCKIEITDSSLEKFILTNLVSIERANGDLETLSRSVEVSIGVL